MTPLAKHVGDIIKPYFLEERHFNKTDSFPYSINPLAFSNYNEETIYEVSGRLGWKKPEDTDANSTNCLLNSYANQIHMDKYGFHPYAYEVAELVRQGSLTRNDGLSRLTDLSNNKSITT